jgi:hypothetical protein
MVGWDNLRPGEALRGKWRQLVGKVREWYVESWHLKGCSPRLCQLRTDGLPLVSKYWTYRSHAGDMGPVSLVVGCRHRVILPPLLQWLARERKWIRTRVSISRCVVDYVRSPFFKSSVSIHRCWWLRKRLSCMRTARRKCMSGVHRLEWKAYVSC